MKKHCIFVRQGSKKATFKKIENMKNAIAKLRNEILNSSYNLKVTGLKKTDSTKKMIKVVMNLNEQTYLKELVNNLVFNTEYLKTV